MAGLRYNFVSLMTALQVRHRLLPPLQRGAPSGVLRARPPLHRRLQAGAEPAGRLRPGGVGGGRGGSLPLAQGSPGVHRQSYRFGFVEEILYSIQSASIGI